MLQLFVIAVQCYSHKGIQQIIVSILNNNYNRHGNIKSSHLFYFYME